MNKNYPLVVYRATNLKTGSVYIGETKKGLEARRNEHLKSAFSRGNSFIADMRKYGMKNFKWEIIDVAKDKPELREKEAMHIAQHIKKLGFKKVHNAISWERPDEYYLHKSKGAKKSTRWRWWHYKAEITPVEVPLGVGSVVNDLDFKSKQDITKISNKEALELLDDWRKKYERKKEIWSGKKKNKNEKMYDDGLIVIEMPNGYKEIKNDKDLIADMMDFFELTYSQNRDIYDWLNEGND